MLKQHNHISVVFLPRTPSHKHKLVMLALPLSNGRPCLPLLPDVLFKTNEAWCACSLEACVEHIRTWLWFHKWMRGERKSGWGRKALGCSYSLFFLILSDNLGNKQGAYRRAEVSIGVIMGCSPKPSGIPVTSSV